MAELTTNTLIKIVLGVFVLVIIIITASQGADYIKNYFSGFGFNESSSHNNLGGVGGGADVCGKESGRKIIGRLEKEGNYYYFYIKNKNIGLYIDKDGKKIKNLEKFAWIDLLNPDSVVGQLNGIHIEIYNKYVGKNHFSQINNAVIGGFEICK